MHTITIRSTACVVDLVDLSIKELEFFAAQPDVAKRGDLLQDLRAELTRRAGIRTATSLVPARGS